MMVQQDLGKHFYPEVFKKYKLGLHLVCLEMTDLYCLSHTLLQ